MLLMTLNIVDLRPFITSLSFVHIIEGRMDHCHEYSFYAILLKLATLNLGVLQGHKHPEVEPRKFY